MNHIPKGGMCSTCKHMNHDCRSLRFDEMPVVKVYKDGTRVVRCTGWARRLPCDNGKS